MEKGQSEPGAKQRWSAGRKRDVVLRLMRGEAIDAVSREMGVEIYRLEEWRKKALEGMERALKSREGDPLDEKRKAAKLHIATRQPFWRSTSEHLAGYPETGIFSGGWRPVLLIFKRFLCTYDLPPRAAPACLFAH